MRFMTILSGLSFLPPACRSFPAAILLAGVAASSASVANVDSDAAGTLAIRPNVAAVTIAPGGSGRRPLRLPSLTFSFELAHACAPGYTPASLSVAIADSRRSLGRAVLVESEGMARIDMDVPSGQLPPLIVSDFCTAEDAANGTVFSERVMSGVLSASASLRCENETESHTTYAVAPLDISLVCETPAAETE